MITRFCFKNIALWVCNPNALSLLLVALQARLPIDSWEKEDALQELVKGATDRLNDSGIYVFDLSSYLSSRKDIKQFARNIEKIIPKLQKKDGLPAHSLQSLNELIASLLNLASDKDFYDLPTMSKIQEQYYAEAPYTLFDSIEWDYIKEDFEKLARSSKDEHEALYYLFENEKDIRCKIWLAEMLTGLSDHRIAPALKEMLASEASQYFKLGTARLLILLGYEAGKKYILKLVRENVFEDNNQAELVIKLGLVRSSYPLADETLTAMENFYNEKKKT